MAWLLRKLIKWLGLRDLVDGLRYVYNKPLTKEVWEFIYEELRSKSLSAENPEDARETSSARGEQILKDKSYRDDLLPFLTDVTYDESLLLWHIATELLYMTEGTVAAGKNDGPDYREISKLLSDYMLYLLVLHPDMMSIEAGIGTIRFRDTCAEAKRLFTSKNLGPNEEKEACEEIVDVKIYVKPLMVKGDRSKSVLFDASRLALVLNEMEDSEDKWITISKVWVELLSYTACNCVARAQAQQVSKGGELIAFIWLLMAHFGIGKQFQINKGQGITKLIVGK